MDEETFVVRAPGKISLLGEYAVLEEDVPAVAAAISKFIYCAISPSDKIIFTSKRIDISKVEYEYIDQEIRLKSEVKEIDVLIFSKNAMEITLRYLEEKEFEIKNFEINILSDLSNRYGVKFGFGSSAAVTVAIVGAILYFHDVEINNDANREVIFKLSSIAHYLSQGSGSGVDVAASTFGGLFVYHSYSSDWMKKKLENLTSIRELVIEPWKFFYYEKILVLIDFFLCVGWTGKSASTKYFLEQVKKVKFSDNEDDLKFYSDFLKTTKNLVNMFVYGIRNDKKELINKSIVINRNLLKELSTRAETEMETEPLKYLIAVAKKLGFEAKFSGAGGGDCGYAVVYDTKSEKGLKNAWRRYGIEPIDIQLEETGVCEVNFAVKKDKEK